jgi:hypothetical protein
VSSNQNGRIFNSWGENEHSNFTNHVIFFTNNSYITSVHLYILAIRPFVIWRRASSFAMLPVTTKKQNNEELITPKGQANERTHNQHRMAERHTMVELAVMWMAQRNGIVMLLVRQNKFDGFMRPAQ